jgi:dihydrofolate reductase
MTMRKLKLQVQVSVDGYIADTNGKTDWMVWNWGPEWIWDAALRRYFIGLKDTIDCVLLSRKMAEEGFIAHWAKTAEDAGNPQFPFAKKITDAHKVVFSKTLTRSVWASTTIAGGDLIAEVNKLKSREGKDIIVYGGATFASSLIEAGLIDEFYLFVNPTILGNGMSIFKSPVKSTLSLISAESYDCGVAVLVYAPGK